jgi:hypothetical protein
MRLERRTLDCLSGAAGGLAWGEVLHHGAVQFHDGVMDFSEEGGVGLAARPLLEAGDRSAESLEKFIAGHGLIDVAAEIGANLLLEADVNESGQGRQQPKAGGSSFIRRSRLHGRNSRLSGLFASRHNGTATVAIEY